MAFKEENTSFAVGHMALAYLLCKASAKPLKINPNIPLILVLSVISDIDIFTPELHRGPTHSVITAFIVFIPIFAAYRQKAVPYIIALLSHSLIGDFFIGGRIQLLWPISLQQYGTYGFYISILSPLNMALELTLFIISMIVMLKSKDLLLFFRNDKSNLMLIIPIFTVLLPTFVGYPLHVPTSLVPPHIFYLVLFSIAVFIVTFRSVNGKVAPKSLF